MKTKQPHCNLGQCWKSVGLVCPDCSGQHLPILPALLQPLWLLQQPELISKFALLIICFAGIHWT